MRNPGHPRPKHPAKNPAWYKGMPSPNPGGRRKVVDEMSKAIYKETNGGMLLVALALDVVKGRHELSEDAPSWRYCHDWLTTRMAGKTPVKIEVGDAEPKAGIDYSKLSDATLREIAEAASAEAPDDPQPEDPGPPDGTLH